MWALLVAAQVVLIPIQGLLWWGLRMENEKKDRLLRTSMRALGIIVMTRGKSR